jgi:hypothetical protein
MVDLNLAVCPHCGESLTGCLSGQNGLEGHEERELRRTLCLRAVDAFKKHGTLRAAALAEKVGVPIIRKRITRAIELGLMDWETWLKLTVARKKFTVDFGMLVYFADKNGTLDALQKRFGTTDGFISTSLSLVQRMGLCLECLHIKRNDSRAWRPHGHTEFSPGRSKVEMVFPFTADETRRMKQALVPLLDPSSFRESAQPIPNRSGSPAARGTPKASSGGSRDTGRPAAPPRR